MTVAIVWLQSTHDTCMDTTSCRVSSQRLASNPNTYCNRHLGMCGPVIYQRHASNSILVCNRVAFVCTEGWVDTMWGRVVSAYQYPLPVTFSWGGGVLGGWNTSCPRGFKALFCLSQGNSLANAKVPHGDLNLVNMSRGGEHWFQELSYGGLKFMSSVRGVRWIAHTEILCTPSSGRYLLCVMLSVSGLTFRTSWNQAIAVPTRAL